MVQQKVEYLGFKLSKVEDPHPRKSGSYMQYSATKEQAKGQSIFRNG